MKNNPQVVLENKKKNFIIAYNLHTLDTKPDIQTNNFEYKRPRPQVLDVVLNKDLLKVLPGLFVINKFSFSIDEWIG